MRHTLLFAALLATIPAAACHSSVGGPGSTGGSTTSSGNGAGGMGEAGSCQAPLHPDVCNEMMPCPSGTMCVQASDYTNCVFYGASCDPLPDACSAMPTCDCLLNDMTDGIVDDCSGDAMHGLIVNYGFGDSSCCP